MNEDGTAVVFANPTYTPRGDGTFVVSPGKPAQKLTLRQAARMLGRSYWTIWRLYQAGMLAGERPSPHSIMIYADSLQQHIQKTQDPEFWENCKNRAQYSKAFKAS